MGDSTALFSRHLKIIVLWTFIAHTHAIIVDWNTNKGPIIPPTSTPQPVPVPPFRDPAPVWEDQSNDIPNPTPYKYVLPPPSRPKYVDPDDKTSYAQKQPQPQSHGTIISHPNQIVDNRRSLPSAPYTVPALSVQYIPNVGYKYFAVVPSQDQQQQYYQPQADKWSNLKSNDIYDKQDKLNGKYNAKLKKYKVYEKLKYTPYYTYIPKPNYNQYYYTHNQNQNQYQNQYQNQNQYQQQASN